MTGRGLVCAHRGASLDLPDNSMAAFVAAIASGCEIIETDVRRRADGRLVLAHDTWDADSPDAVHLEALIDLARGRIGLDLEIVEPGLERAIVDAVDGFHEWLIVTSTFPEILEEIGRLTQHIDTGLVIEAPYDGSAFEGDPFALAAGCGALVTLIEDRLATPALLESARGSARPLWVWTVNEAERIAALLAEPAVTGVITDDPVLACAVRSGTSLGELGQHPVERGDEVVG
jgi:glycerophosphoryl diester phosphodiesterase